MQQVLLHTANIFLRESVIQKDMRVLDYTIRPDDQDGGRGQAVAYCVDNI